MYMKEFEINTIKEVNKVLARFASDCVESCGIDWEDKANSKHINRCVNKMEENLKNIMDYIDLEEFSCEALEMLGFVQFLTGIMLIPRYLLNALPEGTKILTIHREPKTIGKDNINKTTRNGCIAYGIRNNEIKEILKNLDIED